jgi:parallel beta-helix repeat protein
MSRSALLARLLVVGTSLALVPIATTSSGADTTSATCPTAGTHIVPVSSAARLSSALSHAAPGDTVVLAPGQYRGHFALSRSGTAAQRIVLCGSARTVLDGGNVRKGYGLWLQASYVDVIGLTVVNSSKGIVLDRASHNTLQSVIVNGTGDEGIHLRRASSDDLVVGSTVERTGLIHKQYGEGVYVGSAQNNWCTYTKCQPDKSNGNTIRGNTFSANGAEAIDIKEGTTGGTVSDNTFDGTGSSAYSWVDVKGNGWHITGNGGTTSRRDGYLSEQGVQGWGKGNDFRDNAADVNGPGYGLRVGAKNLVGCDNQVRAAAEGYSDIGCHP